MNKEIEILNKLGWHKSSGLDEWTLAFQPDFRMCRELTEARDVIEKLAKNRRLILGGYEYSLAGDRYELLIRRPVAVRTSLQNQPNRF